MAQWGETGIAADADDCQESDAGVVDINGWDSDGAMVGNVSGAGKYRIGLRFQNVTIPPNPASVDAGTQLEFDIMWVGGGFTTRIFGLEGDTPAWSVSPAVGPSSRTRTDAYIDFEVTTAGNNKVVSGANFQALIKEILDTSWSSGYDLGIEIYHNNPDVGDRFQIEDYATTGGGTAAARLTIVYTEGGEEHSGSFTLSGSGSLTITGKKGALSSTKWPGLGIDLFSTVTTSYFDNYIDELWAAGFREFRVDVPTYTNASWLARSKAAVIRAIAAYPTIKIIWGVSSNGTTITDDNWEAFRTAIKEAAQWAQDNGVYEFQLGNEENFHNDNDTRTDAEIRAGMRSIATECQAIFTNGNISYSFGDTTVETAAWISEGKGDIDIICSNIYKGGDEDPYDLSYQDRMQDLIDEFGESFYLTEFGPSYTSLAHYSADEAVQAQAVDEMLAYIQASGMTRAYFYNYADDLFGARYEDEGAFRKLWTNLKTSYTPYISGGGTLVFTGTAEEDTDKEGSFSLSGGGSLSFTGAKGAKGLFTLSGTGGLTFTGSKNETGVFSLSGSGNLSFDGSKGALGSFALSGSGNLTFTGGKMIIIEALPGMDILIKVRGKV
jgi:hypothetical protein